MKNSIMFSELGNYMNKDFLMAHQTFKIFTKSQKYNATIFSCYSTDENQEENNIKLLNFEEEIEYYKKMSSIKTSEKTDKFKKIIKLSTCSYYIVATLDEIQD